MIIRHLKDVTIIMPTIEENWLAKKTEDNIFSQLVFLGVNDSPDNWEEITPEEYEKRKKKEEDFI